MSARRWAMIAGGIAIVLVFLGIGAAIVGVSWVKSHAEITSATPQSARTAFAEAEARFAGRPPLIEVRDGRPQISESRAKAPASTARLTAMHVMVWEKRQDQLIRFELPYWLLRIKSAPLKFSSYASGIDDIGITMTAEELERYGPGVVVNIDGRHGERVMIWVD